MKLQLHWIIKLRDLTNKLCDSLSSLLTLIVCHRFTPITQGNFKPVYNGPTVAIRLIICALVAIFLYTLK